MNVKYVTASGITIAAGIIGAMTVDPYIVTQWYSNPGQGVNRSCNPMDMLCNTIRSREIYSGNSFSSRSYIDNERTFQNRLSRGAITAGITGTIVFGSVAVASRFFKSKTSE